LKRFLFKEEENKETYENESHSFWFESFKCVTIRFFTGETRSRDDYIPPVVKTRYGEEKKDVEEGPKRSCQLTDTFTRLQVLFKYHYVSDDASSRTGEEKNDRRSRFLSVQSRM
jgi:hypothetical protein